MTPPENASRALVEAALDRVETVDPLVNAVCTLNPDALDDARRLDEEAAQGRSRGPLHGIPVLVKDNIDTGGLATTAGSLALVDVPPPREDAPLVTRLREAGMVVLGKANLSEWANLRDERSTSGWSAYGGLTRNPYALNRSAGGSSSGSGAGVAAGVARFAVGTETDGSITCPAAFNGCVGLKPTVGAVSTSGAVIVDNTDLESMVDYPFDDELLVLLAEFQVELGRYLSTREGDGPQSMADVVAFNREHADTELQWFGQSFLEQALDAPGLDTDEYAEARAKCLKAGRDDGIDTVLREHELDALVTPSYSPAIPIDLVNEEHHAGSCTQPTAMSGYPILTVPAGLS